MEDEIEDKISAGKVYWCGEWKVRILYKIPDHLFTGVYRWIGGRIDYYGQVGGTVGLFSWQLSHCPENIEALRKPLTVMDELKPGEYGFNGSETRQAIAELAAGGGKEFKSVDALMDDLNSEDKDDESAS